MNPAGLLRLSKQPKSCIWLNFAMKRKICCGQMQKYLQSGKRTKAGLSILCVGCAPQGGVSGFAFREAELFQGVTEDVRTEDPMKPRLSSSPC